jgi:hypothetical protein
MIMKYKAPGIKAIKFEINDVITTSGGLILDNYVAVEDGNNYKAFDANWLN